MNPKIVTKLNAESIALGIQEVYVRRRAGLLTAKDAKEELVMLETLRKTYEAAILEKKCDRLAQILED